MLQSQDVLGLFHDANLAGVALVTATNGAGVGVGNIKTNRAQLQLTLWLALQGHAKGSRQVAGRSWVRYRVIC